MTVSPKSIKITGLTQLRRKLNSKFKIVMNKTMRDKILRNKVGAIIAADIRKNFKRTPSSATRKFREYFEKYNDTHSDYDINNINITFTGELLNDLASNVKADTVNLLFIVEHSDKKHKLLKGARKSKAKTITVTSKSGKSRQARPQKTNKEISEILINDLKLDYLKVTDSAQSEIIKLLRKEISKNIKSIMA
tara:strand:- start:19898 stop:20476 length:579 start_codon:yes stop_codon:yes gene_type:complete